MAVLKTKWVEHHCKIQKVVVKIKGFYNYSRLQNIYYEWWCWNFQNITFNILYKYKNIVKIKLNIWRLTLNY